MAGTLPRRFFWGDLGFVGPMALAPGRKPKLASRIDTPSKPGGYGRYARRQAEAYAKSPDRRLRAG